MPLTATPSASPRPSTLAKMEDRKRPAISSADDLAPPSKRVAVNGSKAKEDALEMKEEGWIEVSVRPTPFPIASARGPSYRLATSPMLLCEGLRTRDRRIFLSKSDAGPLAHQASDDARSSATDVPGFEEAF